MDIAIYSLNNWAQVLFLVDVQLNIDRLGIFFDSKELVLVIELTFVVKLALAPKMRDHVLFSTRPAIGEGNNRCYNTHNARSPDNNVRRYRSKGPVKAENWKRNRISPLIGCLSSTITLMACKYSHSPFLSQLLTLNSTIKKVNLPPPFRESDDNKSDRCFRWATTRELRSRVSLSCRRMGKNVTYWSNFQTCPGLQSNAC